MHKFDLLTNGIWALPLLIILKILNLFIKIRITKIRSDRMGHFGTDACEQHVYVQSKRKKHYNFFCFDKIIVNHQWADMIARKLIVNKLFYYLFKYDRFFFKNSDLTGLSTENNSRDVNNFFYKYKATFPFTDFENIKGKKWLKSKGINNKQKYVCLYVRDNNYLETYKKKYMKDMNHSWDYHSYRDCEIDTYKLGLNWLTKKGFFIIRMGRNQKKQFYTNNDKIIDYAFDSSQSDFLDIWLSANCDFCISTGTGLDCIPHVYGKTALFLNYMPFTEIPTYIKSLTAPKNLYWKGSGNKLNLDEYFNASYTTTDEFDKNEIEIKDLSERQILKYTKEFYSLYISDKYVLEKLNKFKIVYQKKLLNYDYYSHKIVNIYSGSFLSEEFFKENI